MFSSGSNGPLVDIEPARSPILAPIDSRGRSSAQRNRSVDSFRQIPEEPDDDNLEFLAPGNWDESREDEEESDEESDGDEDSLEDWSLEDGHIEGVSSSRLRLDAKQYQSPEFASSLLTLLRDDLKIPGWYELPYDVPSTLLHIHKVSGSLTNAVFFVSIPAGKFDIVDVANRTPMLTSATLATFAAELEKERMATSTPRPGNKSPTMNATEPHRRDVHVEAPTLLLRIYGPSSGSLISRKTELHILHTLSSDYAIGPKVLGTFTNGRVEEYFHSRALNIDEMREPRVSRWIGRRMRELHGVDLEKMEVPGGDSSSTSSSSGRPERPGLDVGGRNSSSASVYSTSSGSSVFSFGTSIYSTSSAGSTSSLTTLGSEYGTPLVSSPLLMPQRGTSESRAASKRRSRSSIIARRKSTKDTKLGVWENITRWTREAKLVLKELDQLASLPGFSEYADQSKKPKDVREKEEHVVPLSSPSLTLALRAALNLPLFEQQVKMYRSFVREWEKREGKSKRVFSHNDTQYGNLLLLTPNEDEDEKALETTLKLPHQKIIVVDFEYASANPRGFDIANHFIEWQADYHHESFSHSLFAHGTYPTTAERARFLRAYVGCDKGFDGPAEAEPQQAGNRSPQAEDGRVLRLQDEVKVWEPSSHAMWAVWGIVQAKEDLLTKVAKWKKACERGQKGVEKGIEKLDLDEGEGKERPQIVRGKSGEVVPGHEETEGEEVEPEADFDYLSYALGRITLFREELKALRVVE